MPASYEVVIVGAGSAGLAALREVRKRTTNFLLINDGPWGTTCARVGCMPSKVLIEAANAFHRRHHFEEFGIRGAASLSVDLPAVLRRVRRLRDGFVKGTLSATEGLGEQALAGRARLLGPGRLVVNDREISAKAIVLAPGSSPVVPPAWRVLGKRLLTTDDLFEQEDLPSRIAVVGLGAIGVEMAQALARLGLAVTAFGRGHIGGLSDARVSAVAAQSLAREFTLHLGEAAEFANGDRGIEVRAGSHASEVDAVLAALGRRPNLGDLGLENLGIALDAGGLPPVDPNTQQIGDWPIFLAGDATGRRPLLHEAADEGHIAGLNALRVGAGERPTCYARRTPLAIVFSEPNIAVVGRRRAELVSDSFIEGEIDFSRQGRARAGQRNEGLLRIYADRTEGRLLGAELFAPAGEHMAHLIALAIDRNLNVRDFLRLPFYHPVLEEGLRSALRELAAQLPATGESDLASCGDFGRIGAEALD
ncbi:MAG: dihydrolipoyl dehydrogenase [Betaproteobacteria bacterium]|nr:dihydrolipoyl dehydrogenase [Betaproteobacteria bacterium]